MHCIVSENQCIQHVLHRSLNYSEQTFSEGNLDTVSRIEPKFYESYKTREAA